MYRQIKKDPLAFPRREFHKFQLSPDAEDLLRKLLIKDPHKRLGTKKDLEEVITHPWFRDIDL